MQQVDEGYKNRHEWVGRLIHWEQCNVSYKQIFLSRKNVKFFLHLRSKRIPQSRPYMTRSNFSKKKKTRDRNCQLTDVAESKLQSKTKSEKSWISI